MGITVGLSAGDWLWRFDRLFYDTQLMLWERPAPNDIIIVAIDEQSLTALGRWPWSRGVHAALIDKLTRAGAKAVLVDIAFVQTNNHDLAGDAALIEAVRDNRNVFYAAVRRTARCRRPTRRSLADARARHNGHARPRGR